MFLADSMRIIASGLPGDDDLPAMGMRYIRDRCADTVDNSELYSFSRSALEMASDLLIDTPDRLERVSSSVLEKPRRVFIETGYQDRLTSFSTLRGFPNVNKDPDRYDPKKVGLDITCFGDGKACVGVFWNFPKTSKARMEKSYRIPDKTRLSMDALREVMSFGVGFAFLDIDLAKKSNLDKPAFLEAMRSNSSEISEFRTLAEGLWRRVVGKDEAEPTPRERQRIELEAWRLYRLNSMASARPDRNAAFAVVEICAQSGQPTQEILKGAMGDLDGEIIYAIALLAALDASGDSLTRERRAARAARRSRQPASVKDLQVDEISVLSFDTAGSPRRDEIAAAESGISASGGPRVRHPVRGHLFLARNGKMTYRRAHWRGGNQAKKVIRVLR